MDSSRDLYVNRKASVEVVRVFYILCLGGDTIFQEAHSSLDPLNTIWSPGGRDLNGKVFAQVVGKMRKWN